MTSRVRLVLLVALAAFLVLCRPRLAVAAPMITSLSTLRAEADTVLLGTMGPGLVLDVDTVVKGSSPFGPRQLRSPPEGMAFASGRVLVVLDAKGAFRWVGTLVAGPKLETGVLLLSGFFDLNAHFVSPGVMTLTQLEGYLRGGPLTQAWVFTITGADGKGGSIRSGTTFTVDLDPIARTSALRGPAPGACLGRAHMDGSDGLRRTVRLSGGCAGRRLDLDTTITGVDATGAITADASPSSPFLHANELGVYLQDPAIVDATHTLVVEVAPGVVWHWRLGDALVEPPGRTRRAEGASSRPASSDGRTVEETYTFENVSVVLTSKTSTTISLAAGGSAASLVPFVEGGGVLSCVLREAARADRPCTLRRGPSRLVKRMP